MPLKFSNDYNGEVRDWDSLAKGLRNIRDRINLAGPTETPAESEAGSAPRPGRPALRGGRRAGRL
jgi:hypothetical protein